MKRPLIKLIACIGCLAIAASLFFLIWNRAWLPTHRPIIVAEMRNFAVMQIHGGLGFYDTSFCVKEEDSWKWFYLDHDTGYWDNASLQFQDQDGTVKVFRGKRLLAQFNSEKGLGFYTQKGLVYEKPVGSVGGDLVNNWNNRKDFPD